MPSQTTTNDREVYALPIGPLGSNQIIVLPPTWVIPTSLVAPPVPEDAVIVEAVLLGICQDSSERLRTDPPS